MHSSVVRTKDERTGKVIQVEFVVAAPPSGSSMSVSPNANTTSSTTIVGGSSGGSSALHETSVLDSPGEKEDGCDYGVLQDGSAEVRFLECQIMEKCWRFQDLAAICLIFKQFCHLKALSLHKAYFMDLENTVTDAHMANELMRDRLVQVRAAHRLLVNQRAAKENFLAIDDIF